MPHKTHLLAILLALFMPLAIACQKEAPVTPDNADTIEPPSSYITLSDSLFFREQQLYAHTSADSPYWRIPAICTLDDGTLLAVNDRRKNNEGDLPQDIDILCRRSTDNGLTWSAPIPIALGTGYKQGYGDPALLVCNNGDVLCAYAGHNGLWQSTESDPIRSYIARSTDGGITWQPPQDITSLLWGSQAEKGQCKNYKGAFFASGNGLRLQRGNHAGRLMFVSAMVRKSTSQNVLDNFVVYSDDDGISWHVSNTAFRGGDEAKVVELVDGRVLMSIRQHGARGYNVSADGGENWGTQGTWPEMTANGCNGDLLRLSATDQGGERNILLHSLPNSMNREQVSLFISYDEGATWTFAKTLFSGPSAYSSLTLQHNGTIGAYLERNPSGFFEMWYQNFTLPWIMQP